jgi:hypothetical protein
VRRQSTIDESAIYDDVDVVEAVPNDRDSRADRHPKQGDGGDRSLDRSLRRLFSDPLYAVVAESIGPYVGGLTG